MWGESDSHMFGGNSNWRGPIWFPIAYLIIEALERYHHFYGDQFKVELPTGSGRQATFKKLLVIYRDACAHFSSLTRRVIDHVMAETNDMAETVLGVT